MSFTAQDIKDFVLGTDEEQQDGDYCDGRGWYDLTWKRTVPNPNANPEHVAKAKRLYDDYNRIPRRTDLADERNAAYQAWCDYVTAHHETASRTIEVDWVYTCPKGREFPITVIQDESGGEGHGEEAWLVFSVGDRIFRVDGSYYSYDGTTWDDDSFREVKAVTKAVTFYE